MEQYTVYSEIEDCGKRIDIFLSEEIDFTRSKIQIILKQGLVKNQFQIIEKPSYTVKQGDIFVIDVNEPQQMALVAQDIPIDIIFQDEDIVVVNKSKGMVVHPGPGNFDNTLVNALLYHIADLSSINGIIRPGIVHRLDKDTTGLIVVAKNDCAHNDLAAQFSQRKVNKKYIGIVDGNFEIKNGIIEKPIGRSIKNRKKMAIVSLGRYAKTEYNVIEEFKSYSLINYRLHTGRTHQIRVHSQSIGHPIVGDNTYGGSNAFEISGQLLHSWYLGFTHPSTGEHLSFSVPPPNDFIKVLNLLRDSNCLYNDDSDSLLTELLDNN